jgi:methionine synthase I (cobalamin-dependent)
VKILDLNSSAAAIQRSTAQHRVERMCAVAGTVSPTAHAARFLGTSGSFADWKIAKEEQAP